MSDDDTPADPGCIISDSSGSGSGTTAAAPVAVPAGLHSVVSPFEGNYEWIECTERLKNYFIANDITDVAKR